MFRLAFYHFTTFFGDLLTQWPGCVIHISPVSHISPISQARLMLVLCALGNRCTNIACKVCVEFSLLRFAIWRFRFQAPRLLSTASIWLGWWSGSTGVFLQPCSELWSPSTTRIHCSGLGFSETDGIHGFLVALEILKTWELFDKLTFCAAFWPLCICAAVWVWQIWQSS